MPLFDRMPLLNSGSPENHDAQDCTPPETDLRYAAHPGPVALAIHGQEADVAITIDPGATTASIRLTGQDQGDGAPTWGAGTDSSGRPTLEVALAERSFAATRGVTITNSSVTFGSGVVINGTSVSTQTHTSGRRVQATVAPGSSITVETSSGDITLTGADPAGVPHLAATSTSGDIDVDASVRDAQVNTVSGDINLAQVLGTLHAASVSGDVIVAAMNAGDGQVHSVSGDVHVTFQAEAHGAPAISTISGDVRVAGAVPTQAHLSSISGRIRGGR